MQTERLQNLLNQLRGNRLPVHADLDPRSISETSSNALDVNHQMGSADNLPDFERSKYPYPNINSFHFASDFQNIENKLESMVHAMNEFTQKI